MKIIVGLGNPEKKYFGTFHNIGFMTAALIAEKIDCRLSRKECKAVTGICKVGAETVIIALPQTYMNLSGDSVCALLRYYKADLDDLVVIYDDIDVPRGSVRVRTEGSAGTHNGMRDIVEKIGSTDFIRVRIGIGRPENSLMDVADYVLSDVPDESKPEMKKACENAAGIVIDIIKGKPAENTTL